MKKFTATRFPVACPLFVKTARLKPFGYIVAVFLAGCTSTQVHWNAISMREHVIDYYNDEVMDNLIRARNGQPFVHVDVASLSALTTSKLAGTVGGGETITNTGTRQLTNQTVTTNTTSATPSHVVAGTIGVVGTLAHAAMRPFTFGVSPERSDTLTVTSTPVFGDKADKIYDLYFWFLNLRDPKDPQCQRLKAVDVRPAEAKGSEAPLNFSYLQYCCSVRTACTSEEQNSPPAYVPCTLKKRGDCWYYVPWSFREQYLELCRKLLTLERPKAPAVAPGPAVLVN